MARRRMNGSATARISIAVTHAGGDARVLERVLQGEGVDDRRQHAHVVGGGAVHPLRAGREAAEQVAAADHDRGLDAEGLDLGDLLGDLGRDGRVDAELLLAHQGFAGEFQQDPADRRGRHIRSIISAKSWHNAGAIWSIAPIPATSRSPTASTATHSPTLNRTKRVTVMFSPSLAMAACTSCCDRHLGSRIDGWSSRQTCS